MTAWSNNPSIYEINTWVWLNTLSKKYGREIHLGNVPHPEIQELASYHIDAVWLMGVWKRGDAPRSSALNYVHEYRGALPDIRKEDVIGSAYAISDYQVDERIGGRKGMAIFRRQLQTYHIRLILDFVPNHVGMDHPWLQERPDYFITGTDDLLASDPGNFFATKDRKGRRYVVAHGRDPYFPGWIDTAQLNAFSSEMRQAAVQTLLDIASQCDGVRCDMAMLTMDDVFLNTWGWRGVQPLPYSFWTSIIPQVKKRHQDFLFIAETYWGLEYALHLEGFDYTYDKTCYDRLIAGDIEGLRAHLLADIQFLRRNIRFIENHDEPRAAAALGIDRSRPAAVLIATLPGALLLHDGQFTGRRIKLPVQIKRQPDEVEHPALKEFYLRLLQDLRSEIYELGEWRLFHSEPACDGCSGHQNIIAYGWHYNGEYRLIAVNLSGEWSQALIQPRGWEGLYDRSWQVHETLQGHYTTLEGSAIREGGIRLDLEAYSSQILHFERIKVRKRSTSQV